MRGSREVGRARRLVVVLAAAVLPLGGAWIALAGAPGAQAAAGSGPASALTKVQWQAAIAKVTEPGKGCYNASYPALRWHAVKCTVAPKWPLAPAPTPRPATHGAPTTVGNAVDYSAQTSGLISRATGTFQDVSRGITEKGQFDDSGPRIANAFSLQLNTQFFSNSPACAGSGDPSACLGWQQFVYAYESGTGFVFMQYWLIDYDATCPAGWNTYSVPPSTDCYTNSSANTLSSPLTAKDLARVKLSASANSGGNDELSLSVGSGTATLVTESDSMVDLAAFWNTTEWGVFGDAGGGEAFFGARTTLEPTTTLTTTSSSAPECVEEGFTGETNNLTLTSTPALGNEPSPTIASRQTNGSTRNQSCAAAAAADTSATSLKLSASRVTFGHEKAEHLTVHVTSTHSGAVSGKVTVTAKPAKGKSVKVCVITLKSGSGSCTLRNKALKAGSWKLTAAYGGVPGILKSDSPGKALKVRR
jgi:hypothetical protein